MWTCQNGHQVDNDNAKFCPECGQPKPPSTEELIKRLAEKVHYLEEEVSKLQDKVQQLAQQQQSQQPSWLQVAWKWLNSKP